MREPREVTQLRDTLPRIHAVEAFRHLREREPDSDDELDAFIEEYVREAYADGVEDWKSVERARPVSRRSMDAPLGQKLRKAGYDSLWHYMRSHGFSELDSLKSDLSFQSLAPVGFHSYVLEVANEDGEWELAVRALAAHNLNEIRKAESRSFVAFMGIHRIASDSPRELKWIKRACEEIAAHAQDDRTVLASTVNWDDEWLVELIHKHATSSN
jgi:hypothetical protein